MEYNGNTDFQISVKLLNGIYKVGDFHFGIYLIYIIYISKEGAVVMVYATVVRKCIVYMTVYKRSPSGNI